jgi:hypothetical protein
MRIDPAGWPFVLGGVGVAVVAWLVGGWIYGLAFGVLSAFFLFFFRDPERTHGASDSAVVSPADGRVMVAGERVGSAPPPPRPVGHRLASGVRSRSSSPRWTCT